MEGNAAAKPTLTLAEGRRIGVAEIEQLHKALTGRMMTEEERSYAEQALASPHHAPARAPARSKPAMLFNTGRLRDGVRKM